MFAKETLQVPAFMETDEAKGRLLDAAYSVLFELIDRHAILLLHSSWRLVGCNQLIV
jgi:hypothetical protein